MVSSCEYCEVPVELPQLSSLPQSHNEPQPGLEQTQGRVTHIIDQLLLTRGNHVCAPQQQPGVDQRQGQQQPLQAIGMTHSRQLQAEAPTVVFEIFKHLFNPESLLVPGTGQLAGGFRGDQIPRLGGRRRPVHRQIEAATPCFWVKVTEAQKRRWPGNTKGNLSKYGAPVRQTYSWARRRRQTPQPWCSAHCAGTPVPNSRSPSKSTSARRGSQWATTANNACCSAKLEAPGPSTSHSRGKARPRHPTPTYKMLKALHSVR